MNYKPQIRIAIFLILFLSVSPILTAQQHPTRSAPSSRYWIIVQRLNRNHYETETQISNLEHIWPERSSARRRKNGCGYSVNDLPLEPSLITEITQTGAKLVCQSRWLSAISVEANSAQLIAIKKLPFVMSVTAVQSLRRDEASRDEQFTAIANASLPVNEATPLGAYGFSYRQAELARANEVHRKGGMGKGVLIGVLDTGFQLDHCAFAGLDLIAQYDFINHDSDPSYDPRTDASGQAGHGTACLSVIGGYDPARLVGIAPRASFALGKTEDVRSETAIEEDYWIEALEWLEELGADVVSSSLSYRDWYNIEEYDGRSPISRAAERAAELGMVICISAGNAGPGAITIGAPADAAGILAVAAVDSSGRLTNFSSRGPSSDGRVKPDIAAMGRQVVCVKPLSTNEYTRWNGTSLACPIVAGVAALVIEAHPEWPGSKVVQALRMTASQSYMPDDGCGYGMVDAVEAVNFPSITILLSKTKVNSNQYFASVGMGSDGREYFRRAKFENGYAKFVNLEYGNYSIGIGSDGESDLQRYSITVPPSGSLFLKDLNFP